MKFFFHHFIQVITILSFLASTAFAKVTNKRTTVTGSPFNKDLNNPWGIWKDINTGNLYISEPLTHRVLVSDSSNTLTIFAGTGDEGFLGDNDLATNAKLSTPKGIWGDSEQLFICDTTNNRLRSVNLKSNVITTVAGGGLTVPVVSSQTLLAKDAFLMLPRGVWGNGKDVYLSDSSQIYRISSTGFIQLFAGGGKSYGHKYSVLPATKLQLNNPNFIVGDALGNLYVSDSDNNVIRKITIADGLSEIFAGHPRVAAASPDGKNIQEMFLVSPTGLWVDKQQNLVFADSGLALVYRIDPKESVAQVLAGKSRWDGGVSRDDNDKSFGDGGFGGGASFNNPMGLWGDDVEENIYLADLMHSAVRVIHYTPITSSSSAPTNTPVPSPGPTTKPTRIPTTSTMVPSVEPSVAPTNAPVFRPTQMPTPPPSRLPTEVPSVEPSVVPTATTKPSASPTLVPTNTLSSETPTAAPSAPPTDAPVSSTIPTTEPSAAPTEIPSASPSAAPTIAPTTANNIYGFSWSTQTQHPYSVWQADDGTLFMSDGIQNIIYRVPSTLTSVEVFAGIKGTTGYQDGLRLQATFYGPKGIWGVGSVVYICDFYNNRVRALDVTTGVVSTFIGGGSSDPTTGPVNLLDAALNGINAVTGTPDGTVMYIITNLGILKVSEAKVNMVQAFTNPDPSNYMSCDSLGTVYYSSNDELWTLSATAVLSQIKLSPQLVSNLLNLYGVWVDATSTFLYYSVELFLGSSGIYKVELATGNTILYAGIPDSEIVVGKDIGDNTLGDGGLATNANLFKATALWGTLQGDLFVVDSGHGALRLISSRSPATAIPTGNPTAAPTEVSVTSTIPSTEPTATPTEIPSASPSAAPTIAPTAVENIYGFSWSTQTQQPYSVWQADDGTLFMSDNAQHVIYRVPSTLTSVEVFAGISGTADFQDSSRLQAKFNTPLGIWGVGSVVYVCDSQNNRVRALDVTTGVVSTFIGGGQSSPTIGSVNLLDAALNGIYAISGTADGTLMYISTNPGLLKVSGGNLNIAQAFTNSEPALYMSCDSSGTVYYSSNSALWTFSPSTGLSKVSFSMMSNVRISPTLFFRGVWVDATNTFLYYSGETVALTSGIYKIELATGKTIVYAGTPDSGGVIPGKDTGDNTFGNGGLATNANLFQATALWGTLQGDLFVVDYNHYALRIISSRTPATATPTAEPSASPTENQVRRQLLRGSMVSH